MVNGSATLLNYLARHNLVDEYRIMQFPVVLGAGRKLWDDGLKVLERAGLISRGREAQWRPCRLEPESLRPAADWVDLYRRFWDTSVNGC